MAYGLRAALTRCSYYADPVDAKNRDHGEVGRLPGRGSRDWIKLQWTSLYERQLAKRLHVTFTRQYLSSRRACSGCPGADTPL
jgi:hypothetical protein